MRKGVKRLLFYLVCVVFAMGLTTTAVLALRGRCFVLQGNKVAFVACNCSCDAIFRTADGARCQKCGHYLVPSGYAVKPPKAAVQ